LNESTLGAFACKGVTLVSDSAITGLTRVARLMICTKPVEVLILFSKIGLEHKFLSGQRNGGHHLLARSWSVLAIKMAYSLHQTRYSHKKMKLLF